jgi:hypothetical protein
MRDFNKLTGMTRLAEPQSVKDFYALEIMLVLAERHHRYWRFNRRTGRPEASLCRSPGRLACGGVCRQAYRI